MEKKRVLFVDDEANVLQGLRRMLHPMRDQWEMHFVGSGAEALEVMQKMPVDVLVSDMRMPVMNGAQLLEKVTELYPSVVRIILSGHSDRDLILKTVGLAHQFVAKPCEAEALKGIISKSCTLRELFNNETLKQVFSNIQTIPSVPSVYMKMEKELQAENASIQRVGEIISEDPGMTAKVLQMVNSAFFGLPRHVNNPAQAANLLGLETIKALALIINVFSQFKGSAIPGFDIDRLWQHSMNVGVYARQIAHAESFGEKEVGNAFMAGLLHDIGKLIFAENFTNAYKDVLIKVQAEGFSSIDAEYEIIGISHPLAGGYLLSLWGLPDSITESLAYHHDPAKLGTFQLSPLTIVYAANQIDHCFETRPFHNEQSVLSHQEVWELAQQIIPQCPLFLSECGLAQNWTKWLDLCFDIFTSTAKKETVS